MFFEPFLLSRDFLFKFIDTLEILTVATVQIVSVKETDYRQRRGWNEDKLTAVVIVLHSDLFLQKTRLNSKIALIQVGFHITATHWPVILWARNWTCAVRGSIFFKLASSVEGAFDSRTRSWVLRED